MRFHEGKRGLSCSTLSHNFAITVTLPEFLVIIFLELSMEEFSSQVLSMALAGGREMVALSSLKSFGLAYF